MRKKFVTNLALLLVLNMLIKPIWIGIDVVVQNLVGPQEYGNYFAIFQFTFLFNILLDMGITNYNNRNIAQNSQLLSKHFSNLVLIRIILALGYFLINIIAAIFLGWNIMEIKMLLLLLFNQFLLSFILYMRSNLSGLHLFRTDSLVSILDRFLMILICAVLIWGNISHTNFKIEWFIYSQTIAYILTAGIVFIIVFTKLEFLKLRFDLKFFRVILRQSYPFAMLILLMTLYTRINPIMLKHLLQDGDYQSGIYAQSYRLLDAASMFAFLFASLLLPIFSRMIKQKEPLGQMIKLSFSLIIVPVIILAVASIMYNDQIIHLIYREANNISVTTFGILMPAIIFIASNYIFGTLLTANGSLKALNITAAIAMLLNIVLNIILVPTKFATGSAIAALSTLIFIAIAQIIIVMLIFKFRYHIKTFLPFIMYLLVVFVFGYCSAFISGNWVLNLVLFVAASFIIAFLFRIYRLKSFYEILKYGDN